MGVKPQAVTSTTADIINCISRTQYMTKNRDYVRRIQWEKPVKLQDITSTSAGFIARSHRNIPRLS